MPLIRTNSFEKEKAAYILGREVSARLCSEGCLLRHLDESSRIVRTGQTRSTELTVLLGKDRLLVPLCGEKRQRVHILGEQDSKLSPKDRWQKVMELRHPAIMKVYAVCDCMAEVGICEGAALEDANTTPLWKVIRDQLTGVRASTSGTIPYVEWQGWMRDLAGGLAALEAQGLAHGDPFPFNAVKTNDGAVWVDLGHLTDDPSQVMKDAWAFILFTLLHTHRKTDGLSKSMLAEVVSALTPRREHGVFASIEQVLSKAYTDWIPLSDAREPAVYLSEAFVQHQALKQNDMYVSLALEVILKGSAQYFSDFLHHIALGSNYKQIYGIESQRHRLMEQEMLRLTVPRAEHDRIVLEERQQCERNIQEMLRLTVPRAEHDRIVLEERQQCEKIIAERDAQIVNLTQALIDRDKQEAETEDRLRSQEQITNVHKGEVDRLYAQLNMVLRSRSWRLTKPFRFIMRYVRNQGIVNSDRDAIRHLLQQTYRRIPLPMSYKMKLRSLFIRLTGWSTLPVQTHISAPPRGLLSLPITQLTSVSEFSAFRRSNEGMGLVPFFGVRRPYGKRRAAILTNQLLDWHDGRPRFGGGERYALELARLLEELGITVTFFQPSFKGTSEGEYYSFQVKTVRLGDAVGEFQYGVCTHFTEIASDYDHVYYHLPEYASGLVREDGLMTCHGIWFDHNNYPGALFRTNEWFNHLYRAFANPLSVTSVDTNSISVIRSLWPELAGKMHYIPNFYDGSKYWPQPNKRDPDRLTVLFPRRSQVNRGSRIFGEIVSSIPHDVKIVWVGKGDPVDTELIKKICDSDPRVSFYEADFDEMVEWYQSADIAVIPTIACEGTSLSCIEALASGCAVVATNVGGLTDIVHDGFNGLLVDPKPRAISGAINSLIENRVLRERLQQVGCESVKSLELSNWRHRWVQVFYDHGWIDDQRYARWKEKAGGETVFSRRPRSERWVILTRNAIHGGVESIIREQSRLLNAPVIVCGGHDMRNTCPFDYARADSAKALRKTIEQYDVILYHWLPDWAIDVLRETDKYKLEFVHRSDTSESDKTVPTGVVTHSAFLAKHVYEQYGRLCRVVEHPIDTERFVPPVKRGEYIGAITSYYETKGIDIFLQAWATIKEEFPEIPVRFYGAGDDRHKFEKMASSLGLEVEFRSATERPWEALRDFRCFVVPSRIEGFPVAILEALSMNIPVVASDLSGILEFNETTTKRGYLPYIQTARCGDPDDLAKVIRATVLRDREQNSRDYISEYFTPRKHCDDLRNVFLEFVKRA